ncbi:hypothetical protein NCCP2495_17630 [Dietzia sp. NCCP-2495]|uniref:hypothetical protein n=1 Tax=Dietzia sp. NCCP-2495 TaxID=2934675 RepID=UPI00222E1C21|nr:hypothetical protein [Dietzia sp. NCCP-2495]GLB63884.1 hypothetical protein NCCP2495_17630 [Dietzia sp. NCCP-2495]
MTAATLDAPRLDRPRSPSWVARIPAAFRLHFIVPTNLILVPAMVFVLVWALSIEITLWIHAALGDRVAAEDPMYGGASQAAVWTLAFLAAYTVTHTLPFAMALSYSRRTFVLGTYLAFAAVSAGVGVAYTLAAWIERVTNGFGIHAYQFDSPFMTSSNGLLGGGLLAGSLSLAVMVVTFLFAAVFRRISLMGFWALLVALLALVALVMLLIVRDIGWSGIGSWFLHQTALTGSKYLLTTAVAAGVLGYLVLRRHAPSGN